MVSRKQLWRGVSWLVDLQNPGSVVVAEIGLWFSTAQLLVSGHRNAERGLRGPA